MKDEEISEIKCKIDEVATKLTEMHVFIFGVEKKGGLANIVDELQKDVKALHLFKAKVLGMAAAISALGAFAGSKLSQLIFGK